MIGYEEQIKQVIFPELLRGRKEYDLPHTQSVLHWMKQILKTERQLDRKILVTAAIAHDWGYIDLQIPNTVSLDQIHITKEKHMQVGSERIHRLLVSPHFSGYYTPSQIERITHLVLVHDKLREVKDDDEIALVEADTLGALDTDRVKPTFTKEDNTRYINEQVMPLRRPLFRHSVAIDVFNDLLQKRISFYE